VSNGWEMHSNDWDGSYVHTARIAARRAYAEAGITRPREQISMTEVHDCFSITELVTMEDLGLSDDGGAVRDVLDGRL
jgi:acetyl-CoA C-acetyltransferase